VRCDLGVEAWINRRKGLLRYNSTTGLSRAQQAVLIARVVEVFSERPPGQGWRHVMPLPVAVLLVLVKMRQNLAQTVVGDWFGISQPVVSRIWNEIRPVIGQVCAPDLGTLDDALRDGAVLIDGSVIPMWDWHHLGTSHFSGKHHVPGFNVQIAADLRGNLLASTTAVPGARHDSAAIELAGWDQVIKTARADGVDHGLVADNAYSKYTHLATRRKPPGAAEMPEHDATFNHQISTVRAAVERCIAHVKNWKILTTGITDPLKNVPDIIQDTINLEAFRQATRE
jgi:hypothetical protein